VGNYFIYRELDEGLEEPIATLLWAAPRLQAEVPELKIVAEQLTLKYSKEFALSCRTNTLENVNEKVMHKLGVQVTHIPATEQQKCKNKPLKL